MQTSTDRRSMLLAMKDDLLRRRQEAQADLDAVDRLIAAEAQIGPQVVSASGNTIKDQAIAILEVNGKPTHRDLLLVLLEESGVHVGGKNPGANLVSILSRNSEIFQSFGKSMWGLKQPHPVPAYPDTARPETIIRRIKS